MFLRHQPHPPPVWREWAPASPKIFGTSYCSCNKYRKQRPNRCIIGDAILPQTGTKLTKKCGCKFGALLWRHLTPQRKTAIQVHNYNPSLIQYEKKQPKFAWWSNLMWGKLLHGWPRTLTSDLDVCDTFQTLSVAHVASPCITMLVLALVHSQIMAIYETSQYSQLKATTKSKR